MAHSALATPRATIAVLKRHGLATKKSLGQHFLIDDNVIGRILTLAAIEPTQRVLEVGPGIGTLTLALCEAAGSVVAVERDTDLLAVLAETTAQYSNLMVINADAVQLDPRELVGEDGPPVAFVANLPYAVAATLVLRVFETMPSIRSATVMVQAEVADRMAASPGTKDYGAYTVKLALRARPAGRFNVPPGCFLPPPRVDSAVLRLERLDDDRTPEDVARATRAADAAFSQRRKTIRNSLSSALGAPASAVEDALRSAGVEPGLRAETLPVETFVKLGSELHAQGLLP
ncbi:MAG: 16S rRNA (adenine(1518)-N(6)/adenine(1519)-N(6))-dimethyltransferase RsmA [Actinobacteria bacterium HGW-Actinobacteria-1]|jgi:16S rRNA (adenine1518-N6/adenine1519-N6)-dimethyltransferase|nr:MAG: 16S rRNA (adenine(1518)-N(6)/adenine(1519)-N(6))-dimethyltransferase RsmA [Actinobacteria bacterium HGW-Actinobacteria-1]